MKYVYYFMYRGLTYEMTLMMMFFSSLVAVFFWYFLRLRNPKKKSLSQLEEDLIIENFQPEELILDNRVDCVESKKHIVTSIAGKNITVDGRVCLNLATHNYLCLVEDAEVKEKASESINKYGVGSCGPRGFYGTVDVHLELEEKLAEFMEVEEACVYSYAFATMASAIPAYCKRGDIVFADEAVNFSIQKGLDASRSTIKYFKHNDMTHLESILREQRKLDQRSFKQTVRTRKFLIAEGIYINTGNICNLPELVRLRKEFKLRLLLDESISFGTIGATGKGVVEYYNVPHVEVDLRIGSMEGSLASIGGFCCGASFIVEHQRLSGIGYCFSASLPPVLAVAALTSLNHMRKQPELFQMLAKVSGQLHMALSAITGFTLGGDTESPVKHLYLKKKSDRITETKILSEIVDYCIEKNIAVTLPEFLTNIEKFPVRPSLRITSNVSLTLKDINTACSVIQEALQHSISKYKLSPNINKAL